MKKLKWGFLLFLMTAVLLSGCGVQTSHKSPDGVVKSIVNAYQYGKEDAVKKCYGIGKKDKLDDTTKEEIDYNIKFFKAHQAKNVRFVKCKSLGSFNGFELVYVIYNFEIKKEADKKENKKAETLEAPAISLYFVNKKDKKYYVVPTKDITAEMGEISKTEYSKFVKTDDFIKYQSDYDKFIKANPSYEQDISEQLNKLTGQKKTSK